MRTEILLEQGQGVNGPGVSLDDDSVSLKKLVSFVTGKEEAVVVVRKGDRSSRGKFSVVEKCFVIRDGQFSQPHESKETGDKL